jgi:archaellum component FlaC
VPAAKLAATFLFNVPIMPRKKIENRDEILAHNLIVRVNNKLLKRLEDLHKNSNCQSVAEVARRILEKERITIFHKDISMNGIMEELTGIRKELKAIGNNINQVTRKINSSSSETQQAYYTLKAAELYQKVEPKVNRLLTLVSQLTQKWLQRS